MRTRNETGKALCAGGMLERVQWFGSPPNSNLRLPEFSGRVTSWATKLHTNHPWLVLVLLVQLVAIASGQVKEPDCAKARSHLSSAQAAIDAKDSGTALQELNQAVHTAPRCADAYLMLGLMEFHNGATADAIQNYQRATQLRPWSYSIHYDLALAYLKEQNLQEARAHLEKAVMLDPRQVDAMYNLGIVLDDLGHATESLVKLQRAKALDAKRPDVTFNIVRVQLNLGLVSDARAEASNSAKKFGTYSHWCAAIGQLFLQKDQPKDAVPYLQQAVGSRPDDAELRHQLAVAYLQSGQADEVLRTIVEPTTADEHYLRASAFYLSHQYAAADSESEEALQLAPDSPQILVLRTRLLQRAGDQDQALRVAQKTIALAPTWVQPYYLAGVSSYFIRLYEEAVKNLARAVELNPKFPRALFVQYLALANLGKLGEAESSLRRAIDLQPTRHLHHGDAAHR